MKGSTLKPDKRYFLQLAGQLIGEPHSTLPVDDNWSAQQLQGVAAVYSKDGVTRTITLQGGKFFSQVQGGQIL